MRMLGKLALAALAVFVVLQFIRPGIPSKPPAAEVHVPPEVKHILEKDCYSCHSDQPRLAWFDQIVPGYWLVRDDILTAREHLNFSTLGAKPPAVQKATLYEAVNLIQLGAMPLPRFVMLHPEAKVTPEELATLKAYLAPWAVAPNAPAGTGAKNSSTPAEEVPAAALLGSVQPELNGLPFDPAFESWKPIDFTDRGDNNSFRFVLGNDIAVRAAQSGNISPWPDGARFAKIAWHKEQGPDGLVYPGQFIQVELMVKDAQRYKDTEGWGWGRWRGLDLRPYGNDAHFVNECTSCHLPVGGDDYVYTLPMTTAKIDRAEVVNNHAAALPGSLPFQPLDWNAITMFVDPAKHTLSALYGNDVAMQAVRARGGNRGAAPSYGAGSVLALVTWAEREDPHWFGARIPDMPQSVEFVQVSAANQTAGYRRFSGTNLDEDHASPEVQARRTSFVSDLAPAQLP
jgi:hypothetical protein